MKFYVTKSREFLFEPQDPDLLIDHREENMDFMSIMSKRFDEEQAAYQEALDKGETLKAKSIKSHRLDGLSRTMEKLKSKYTAMRSWRTAAGRTQHTASNLVRALNPKTVVRWHVSRQHTDFTFWDEKLKKWVITLNPKRLRYQYYGAADTSDTTPHMIQSAIGGALHEVSHTMNSPQTGINQWITTMEALMVSRGYEDVWVNRRMLDRLPGAKPFLDDALLWAAHPDLIVQDINSRFENGQVPDSFEYWATFLGDIELIARFACNADEIGVPAPEVLELLEAVEPYAVQIREADDLSYEERAEIYQNIADEISKRYKMALHEFMDSIQYETTEEGATRTPLDQPIGGEGGPTLQENLQLQSCRNEGNFSESAEDDGVAEQLNSDLDTKEEDRVQDIGGLEYARPTGNVLEEPVTDKNLVDKIRKIFRTRNTERRAYHHGMPEGRLSTRRLHKLVRPKTLDKAVFKRRPVIDSVKSSVLILVDASGSMSGQPYETARLAAQTLYEALRGNNDYRLTLWTYSGGVENITVIPATVDDKGHLVWPQLSGGGTPSYQALNKSHEFLKKNYPTGQRVIIHFTDAYPGDDSGQHSGIDPLDALKRDKASAYISVAVAPASHVQRLAAQHPDLHIVDSSVANLSEAIQEFVLEHSQ